MFPFRLPIEGAQVLMANVDQCTFTARSNFVAVAFGI